MPALRQAWGVVSPASMSARMSRRIAAIWSGLGRFRMGRSLALCQLYDSHYGWTRFWGAGHSCVPVSSPSPFRPPRDHLATLPDRDKLNADEQTSYDNPFT